jgi:hypothetical protein
MKCNQQHIEKPWGWESIIQANEHYAFKRIHIAPGKRLSLQYHKEKMETKDSPFPVTRTSWLRNLFVASHSM